MTTSQAVRSTLIRVRHALGLAAAPAGALWGLDSVTVSAMPAGYPVYGCYFDGTYANETEAAKRFPAVAAAGRLVTITPFHSNGAMCVDVEVGNEADVAAGGAAAVAFMKNASHGAAKRPIVYTMASWADPVVGALRNAGFADDSYFLWTAHYVGQHLCAGNTCGYSKLRPADATQYASNANFDTTMWQGYVFATPTPPAPAPAPITFSATPHVETVRIINFFRSAVNYKGVYVTEVKNEAGAVVTTATGTNNHGTLTVPGAGKYSILTTAAGHPSVTVEVTVA